MDENREFIRSFDAKVWAITFQKEVISKQAKIFDLKWLQGWFASALLRGYDEGYEVAQNKLAREEEHD